LELRIAHLHDALNHGELGGLFVSAINDYYPDKVKSKALDRDAFR
jgi:hypothetical protein